MKIGFYNFVSVLTVFDVISVKIGSIALMRLRAIQNTNIKIFSKKLHMYSGDSEINIVNYMRK